VFSVVQFGTYVVCKWAKAWGGALAFSAKRVALRLQIPAIDWTKGPKDLMSTIASPTCPALLSSKHMAVPLTNALHLYRALLRECTYLPDSQARIYLRDHVIHSYRNYLPRNQKWRKEIPLSRQVALLHRGRKGLSVLRRANEGYIKPLRNVLSWTYGRKGRRRRELMDKLVEQEVPQDDRTVDALSGSQKYSRNWMPPSLVMALLCSQAQQKDLDRVMVGSNNLEPTPAVAETNTWGRQMPEKRVKNLRRRWYAEQIDCLLPPLPEPEFERLQALSDRKLEVNEGPVPRRKRAVGFPEKCNPLMSGKLLLEGPQKSHTFAAYAQGRPHHLTPRLLQRIWLNIFNHVPLATWNSAKETWEVKWNASARARPHVKEASEDRLEALFAKPNT
jgi:Complex 1 protein (LYR family)